MEGTKEGRKEGNMEVVAVHIELRERALLVDSQGR